MENMECIFCGETGYLEGKLLFSRFDKFPVSLGNALIVPRRHTENWFDLTKIEQDEVIDLMDKVKMLLDAEYAPDGYNIGMNCGLAAGQTIPYAHIHVIPRYINDMENPHGGVRGVISDEQQYG